MKTQRKSIWTLLLAIILIVGDASCTQKESRPTSDSQYFFEQPARIWEETFPLGNGRLGMMPDGGITQEKYLLNEISLWSGSPQDTDNPAARAALPQIRNLLFQGNIEQAQQLMYQTFVCKGKGSGEGNGSKIPYGSYQLLGYLTLDYPFNADSTTQLPSYRRTLNLEEAIATTTFQLGTVNYTRESFTSFSEDVGVIHLVADTTKAIEFDINMNRPEYATTSVVGETLWMKGQLSDGRDSVTPRGMRFASAVRIVLPQGGKLEVDSNRITVKQTTEAILLVGMATDYKGQEVEPRIEAQLNAAAQKSYEELKQNHVQAYQKLYKRVELTLDTTPQSSLPMDQRLAAYAQQPDDPELAALYFQFGRYLLISSTRPGSLPPNLQGLWCNTIETPWNGDYHLNINLQMNHWPAEVTNLSELHLPLTDWILEQIPSGERTARAYYNARGWVMHILGNVWQFTAPGEHPSWGATNTSAAWLCQHLYTHYIYTQDTAYLRRVYPALKGASQFFVDMLIEDPRTHYLVTAPTTSPENAYKTKEGYVASVCAGSTMDNQIIRELFTNTIQAANLLQVDTDFVQVLANKRARLMPTTIGQDGRIQEWLANYEEVEPHHRHVSHLYGLYPGDEISVSRTPKLAEAARKSLEVRGDQSTGWSMAWKMNFWARLQDGNHAWKLLNALLRPCVDRGTNMVNGGGTYPNLFCAHPPFQIDGNFGGCAGIAEMLLQSHDGYIAILPALPDAWRNGQFKGLKARGGAEVSAKWREGSVKKVCVKATIDGTQRILLNANNNEAISLKLNTKPVSLPVYDGKVSLDMKAGDELEIQYGKP